MKKRPLLLIVDDEPLNVDVLEQELEELNLSTVSASNGREAMEMVARTSPDLILLDIMMPIMDGFAVLERLKADKRWRNIPVLIISAMTDMDSIVRGIKLGAEDYLPKPFDEVLLNARVGASLEKKRLRDQEIEYLRKVDRLTDAASAVQENQFEELMLADVVERDDALGNLGRVFLRMAQEVHAREQRLRRHIEQLQADVVEKMAGEQETALAYVPMDRRLALSTGTPLADRASGAVLVADVAGFTILTELISQSTGLQRGAEEMTRLVNQLFTSLIEQVHQFGGSIVNFAGDAITCWFAEDTPQGSAEPSWRAAACALAMQSEMNNFGNILITQGLKRSLAIKIAIAVGHVRRFVVGDPSIQLIEVIAGQLMDELADAEHLASGGQILLANNARRSIQRWSILDEPVYGEHSSAYESLVGLTETPERAPWPDPDSNAMSPEKARPWVLATVFQWLREHAGAFLSELRSSEALFMKFEGIEYEESIAEEQLDRFARWVQGVLVANGGTLMQITMGDKGSYLYAAFGVPLAQPNSALRAIQAAFRLLSPPAELGFIRNTQIGIAGGLMRVGTYGSPVRRTFGMQGDKVNLAARLMQVADGHILCDQAIYAAARSFVDFDRLAPIMVKGKKDSVEIFRPKQSDQLINWRRMIDELDTGPQLTIKVASIIGHDFRSDQIEAIYPLAEDRENVIDHLQTLCEHMLIRVSKSASECVYGFVDTDVRVIAYDSMLFAQRRQLHRALANWMEKEPRYQAARDLASIGNHWQKAEDPLKAISFFEKAGEQARADGEPEEALRYLGEALRLDVDAAVLSEHWSR